jgi:hypothetical protein
MHGSGAECGPATLSPDLQDDRAAAVEARHDRGRASGLYDLHQEYVYLVLKKLYFKC